MQARYRVRVPIRAIFDKPDGQHVSVTLPAGAILVRSPEPSENGTLFGMVGVFWEGRHYSVYPNTLLVKAEQIQSA